MASFAFLGLWSLRHRRRDPDRAAGVAADGQDLTEVLVRTNLQRCASFSLAHWQIATAPPAPPRRGSSVAGVGG
ncbi:hypothetical protein BQ8794_150078 [Mesorhizobium prunaredense]|uniref:Uncharacterized protein n=1 Tax=Mesorhizobium prunaredense TaxID=1631249 RepID=A0A1R3V6I1_9HYPH|nr:hypothetical protein BQ8794_150078 [Mesorhizobium prunaredense]